MRTESSRNGEGPELTAQISSQNLIVFSLTVYLPGKDQMKTLFVFI